MAAVEFTPAPGDDTIYVAIAQPQLADLLLVLRQVTARLEKHATRPSAVDSVVIASAKRVLIHGSAALRLAETPAAFRIDAPSLQ